MFDDSHSFITRSFLRAEFDLDYRAYTAESDAELLQRLPRLGRASAPQRNAGGRRFHPGLLRRHLGLRRSGSGPDRTAHYYRQAASSRRRGRRRCGRSRSGARLVSWPERRIPTFAKVLIALHPDVILGRSTAVTRVLLQETRTIPIVFVVVSDPVGDGLVDSMARPGGNVTGFTNVEASLGGKWLELLRDISPRISRVAVMFDPKTAAGGGAYYMRLVKEAAASLAVNVAATPVQDGADIERAIEVFTREADGALIVTPDVTTTIHRAVIIAAAAQHRLPAVYPFRYVAAEGGLASYGVDVVDLYRRATGYVDRILKGPKAVSLSRPNLFYFFVINQPPKPLGLLVPPSPHSSGRQDGGRKRRRVHHSFGERAGGGGALCGPSPPRCPPPSHSSPPASARWVCSAGAGNGGPLPFNFSHEL